ncbi:MAG: hypothetical protein J2P36_25315, partial [Ktedonobacteraceae bacterium]|nr:hypothetical protein [Ktedonobacteraceae bacterium]
MVMNSAGLPLGQGAGEENSQARSEILSAISLRCVECAALYPAAEQTPRYRCDCGGVLDVETTFQHPRLKSQQDVDAVFFTPDAENVPSAGALWRQIFDERASNPPIWSISTDTHQLDYSGVWRYREMILPVPEQYVVSRPEGNTGLYPVGVENCGAGRAGQRQIGVYAGLERLFLKHEGENPTG